VEEVEGEGDGVVRQGDPERGRPSKLSPPPVTSDRAGERNPPIEEPPGELGHDGLNALVLVLAATTPT